MNKLLRMCLMSGFLIAGVNDIHGEEFKDGVDIHTPFIHQKYYVGERDQLGYNPAYVPGIFSFDMDNRPYVRTPEGFVQTLDANKVWVSFDFKLALKSAIPDWDGIFSSGPFAEERLVFDRTGDAYMCVTVSRKTANARLLLLYSHDGCRNWQVILLPKEFSLWSAKLENLPPHLRNSTPPPLSLFNGKALYLVQPVKTASGLKLQDPVLISNDAIQNPTHSGGGNFTVTSDGKTFIVYAGGIPRQGDDGTPQYITVYDHVTKTCTVPFYLGSNGRGKPDNHNLPALEIDSSGYLHVLLGSHHDPFKYLRSLRPYDIAAWNSPETLGFVKTKMGEGSYTYVGVICDRFDNLHLTARWAGNGYKNHLIYMKKPRGKDWQEQKILVEPFKTLYSCFYHKMSQDAYGRIFVNYYYYGNELTADQLAAYGARFPEQKIKPAVDLADFPNGTWINEVKYHDPVCLVSNDSGDSFRLALTPDFTAGMQVAEKARSAGNNSIGMPLVELPSGAFIMGSLVAERYDEKPLRPVTIGKTFAIGQYPVRVKDFAFFVKETGYKTDFERHRAEQLHNWCSGKFSPGDRRTWNNPGIPQTPDDPVVLITLNDAKAFCLWLSKKENADYRLPTEAEWEYACRAGSRSEYFFGDNPQQLPRYGWYKANAAGTKPVGLLLPNAWNLYDMCGNVWEYCADYYQPRRSDLPVVDPVPLAKNDFGPVIRGGSWIDDCHGEGNGANLRSAVRYNIPYPLLQLDWVGFRVVKEIK